MRDQEYPQALALAIDTALDETPRRLIVLTPRVVAIRARVSDFSEKVESIWTIESEFAGETLAGVIGSDLDPDASTQGLTARAPIFIVSGVAGVQPSGLFITGQLLMVPRGPGADRLIDEIPSLVAGRSPGQGRSDLCRHLLH